MTSYKKISEDKYKLYVELGYDDKGKRIRKTKTITITSPRDLKSKIRDFEMECFKEPIESVENITFSKFVDRWIKNYVRIKLTQKTFEAYKYLLDTSLLPHFGNMKLSKIKKLHIVEFFAQEERDGKKSNFNKYTTLRSVFGRAVEWEVIPSNPMKGMEKPKQNKKAIEYYTIEELKHLFKTLKKVYPKHNMLIRLAAAGGLRRGEVLGIRYESVNFDDGSIYVDKTLQFDNEHKNFYLGPTKNKKPRLVFFPDGIMKELKDYYINHRKQKLKIGSAWRYIQDENGIDINLLFTKEDGYPALPNSIGNEWRKIIKKYKLKSISFHALRHSCASLMIAEGINFKIIQDRLGHSDIRMTLNTYSHLSKDQEKKAADVFNKIL